MKKIGALLLLTFIISFSFQDKGISQKTTTVEQEGDSEFAKSKNGLIYPDSIMGPLKHIADSLNLINKSRKPKNLFLSVPQTKAGYISLDGKFAKKAKMDMDARMPFEQFIAKYKPTYERDALVIKSYYKNFKGKDEVAFIGLQLPNQHGPSPSFSFDTLLAAYEKPVKGKWIYRYWAGNGNTSGSLEGFYFETNFQQQAIPSPYASMISYSECIVDTSASIIDENAYYTDGLFGTFPFEIPTSVTEFMDYVNQFLIRPVGDTTDYKILKAQQTEKIEQRSKSDARFYALLRAAVNDALDKGGSNDDFEDLIGRYYSKKFELALKRHRKVVGACSQDNAPRLHIFSIAKLAAEEANWGVFIRAHLDIMNDNFERNSDGSYAQGRRKTYIKELEVLGIDVSNLILGTSLMIGNPVNNHYFGDVGRSGRALSESKDVVKIENRMLEMIANKKLDDYNRMQIYYLFIYDIVNSNKAERIHKMQKLSNAVKTLPIYLQKYIVPQKDI